MTSEFIILKMSLISHLGMAFIFTFLMQKFVIKYDVLGTLQSTSPKLLYASELILSFDLVAPLSLVEEEEVGLMEYCVGNVIMYHTFNYNL
jgi:hypothetical protein